MSNVFASVGVWLNLIAVTLSVDAQRIDGWTYANLAGIAICFICYQLD